MPQDSQTATQFVEQVTASIQSALLKSNVPTEQLFATYYKPQRDVRSENLVVSAVPAITTMRFMAGSIFEFFASLDRPAFAAGEDFLPQDGDVILIAADQDEPHIIQGLAMVRARGERLIYDPTDDGKLSDEDCPNYVSASYELVWTMVRDDDVVVKRLMAAYIAEATRKGVAQLAGQLAAAGSKAPEDVAISYEYYDELDDHIYQMMADNLMQVVDKLGRDKQIRGQFKNLGWLLAE